MNLEKILSQRRYVLATLEGLQWWRFPRWVEFPWTSVRSIGCFTDVTTKVPQSERSRTYLIAADDAIVQIHIAGETSTAASAKNRTASERLLRVIMMRTGLPVRDLNPLATALVIQLTPSQSQDPVAGNQQGTTGISTRAAELLAAFQPKPRRWRRGRLGLTALFALVVASLQFDAYHGLHDFAQPRYLATLPGQIHSHQPLFRDALRHDDGLWPVHQATQSDPRSFAFSPAGYSLSGNVGVGMVANMSPSYGPIAIQVTVSERGAYTIDLDSGVGILLRHTTDS